MEQRFVLYDLLVSKHLNKKSPAAALRKGWHSEEGLNEQEYTDIFATDTIL